jgi:hypothetical protein
MTVTRIRFIARFLVIGFSRSLHYGLAGVVVPFFFVATHIAAPRTPAVTTPNPIAAQSGPQ